MQSIKLSIRILNDPVCEGEDAGFSSPGGAAGHSVRQAGARRWLQLGTTSMSSNYALAEFCTIANISGVISGTCKSPGMQPLSPVMNSAPINKITDIFILYRRGQIAMKLTSKIEL